jgi:hypothetical protein
MLMLSKEFLVKTAKEAVVVFVVALGTVLLAGPGLSAAAATAGLVAGVRAVVGVVIKNVGEQDSPHL